MFSMANEAVLIVEQDYPVNFTVANATGIEKGALLKMTDPNTAIAGSASNDPVAGISYGEKIASDGVTKLAVYRKGIFKMTLSGSATVGDALVIEGASSTNYVKKCPNHTSLSGANIVGTALETGTTGETILVELNPHTVQYS